MEKTADAIGVNLRRKGTVNCTRWFQKGHNKRNCKNQPQVPPLGTYIDKRWTTGYPSNKKRGFGSQTNAFGSEMNAKGSQTNAYGSQMNAKGSQTNAYGSQMNVQRRKLLIRKSSSHATLQQGVSSFVNLFASTSVNPYAFAYVNPSTFVHPTPRQGPRLLGVSSSAP